MADETDADGNVLPFVPGSATPSRGEIGGIGSGVVQLKTEDGTAVDVYEDGTVVIDTAAPASADDYENDEFGANLAERMSDAALAGIADDLIDGVESDISSRSDLIAQYETGIDLLGTRIEDINTPASTGRSVSRVGHPLLLETMIKFHAGAEAELLPAEGPAKIMTVGTVTESEQELADDWEADFNFYLTETAEEYYPDTSSMLMHESYCGNAYKKVYRDAMRQRPVSESVSMLDLIVSEEAKTLQSAIRVTHQIQMSRTELRRMQIAGVYRDIDLGWSQAQPRPGHDRVQQSQGLSPNAMRPQDQPYIIWETDLNIDIDQFPVPGKWESKAPPGLPLPYKVTVDRQTRQVLAVYRNWRDGDPLYHKRNMYVRFGLVPALGFHHWGFLHILGNHTRALRAIWRLLVDSGMFANFPGGVKLRGARTATNEIAPAPGEWIDIDAPGGTDIRQIMMALPYKSVDAVFMQLAQMIEEGAQRLGGNVMLETGEGRTNVPVGTMLSLIEQATQVMAAVHRRNHRAQKEELRLIRELFIENPADLTRFNPSPRRQWNDAQAFADMNLVPASDPNIPSHVHRVQIAVALMTVAQANPQMFDMREVIDRVLRTIRISSPEMLVVQPGAQPAAPVDPMAAMAQQKAAQQQQQAQQKMAELALRQQEQDRQHQQKVAEAQTDAVNDQQDRQQEAQVAALESADRAADRQSHAQIAAMREETARLKLEAERQRSFAPSFGGETI